MTSSLLVIKIGSNVIADTQGHLDEYAVREIVSQVAALKTDGYQIVLVSSGAVAAGMGSMHLSEKIDGKTQRQILAATGQIQLIQKYAEDFSTHDETCAQVLTTKEDFRTRRHYLNIKNGLEGLLAENVIPIVNENDTIATDEIRYGDNDRLAAQVAVTVGADMTVLLSDVDGFYFARPQGSKPPHL